MGTAASATYTFSYMCVYVYGTYIIIPLHTFIPICVCVLFHCNKQCSTHNHTGTDSGHIQAVVYINIFNMVHILYVLRLEESELICFNRNISRRFVLCAKEIRSKVMLARARVATPCGAVRYYMLVTVLRISRLLAPSFAWVCAHSL